MMVKARILRKMIPGGDISWDGGSILTTDFPHGGWHDLSTPGGQYKILVHYSYFDLSGYRAKEETTFPQGVVLQQLQPLKGTGSFIYRLDLATKTPISDGDVSTFLTGAGFSIAAPGSLASNFTLEEVFLGRLQLWEQSVDIAGLQLTRENSWGLADATAGEKIFLATVYYIDVSFPNSFNIPEGAYVIPALIDHEEDLEYIMRLKRAYELQGEA